MKIENKTKWNTKQLRAFLSRVAFEELDAKQRKGLQVQIVYNRAGRKADYVSGHAYLRSNLMQINIGAHKVDKIDLAHTIAHEMAHTRGMTHAQMKGRPDYERVGNWRELYAWAEELPLEESQSKARPKQDVQSVRYRRVLEGIARWETKHKRAVNALKKLRKQRKYYENALKGKEME